MNVISEGWREKPFGGFVAVGRTGRRARALSAASQRTAARLRPALWLALFFLLGPSVPALAAATEESARDILARMTLDEKIGQLFMPGFSEASMTDELAAVLERHKLGGLILFAGRNVAGRAQTARLTTAIQEKALSTGAGIPMLLSIDQEGGVGSHINILTEGVDTTGNMALGFSDDPVDAYASYRVMADDLNAYGVNMPLAPVLDLMLNENNPMDHIRSFGADPHRVASLGAAAARGFQDGGVVATLKHFPGKGESPVDSHVGTPVSYVDKAVLLEPFKAAIDAGADAVMLNHELYPNMDPDNVATVSRKIIADVLRGELGFDGVVITDSITMGGVGESSDQAAVKSIAAGADIVLFAGDSENGYARAIEAVKAALADGSVSQERVDDAVLRILNLKKKYNLWDRVPTPPEVYLPQKKRNERLIAEVARRTVKVLKNENGLLPLDRRRGGRILVVSPKSWFNVPMMEMLFPVGTTLSAKVKKFAPEVRIADYDTVTLKEDKAAALEKARDPNVEVVVFGSAHAWWSDDIVRFARELKDAGKPLVVVGLTVPWDAKKMPFADAFIATSNIRSVSLTAAAELLFGRFDSSKAKVPIPLELP